MASIIVCGLILFIALVFYVSKIIYNAINDKLNFYPNLTLTMDITNKKKMSDDDFIDYYLTNNALEEINNHFKEIEDWKNEILISFNGNEKKIKKFNERCEKNSFKAFKFLGVRILTKYRQINYERHPYKVETISNEINWNENEVKNRIAFLEQHNYNITYSNYNRVDQRNALKKELKEFVKKRDDFTCQICGKYMPDEVGLHIDHIVPVAKGGKSIESNLRVLCSKCNGKKGIKTAEDDKSIAQKTLNNNITKDNNSLDYLNHLEEKFNQSYAFLKLNEMKDLANELLVFQPKTNSEYLSLHYAIMNIANILYSLNDQNENFDKLCENLCLKDIANYEVLFSLLKKSQTIIMTLSRLCIKYEREDKINEAIKLCDIGIKYSFLDTNNKSFIFRKNRLFKKLGVK